jgi:hypothetical protein
MNQNILLIGLLIGALLFLRRGSPVGQEAERFARGATGVPGIPGTTGMYGEG